MPLPINSVIRPIVAILAALALSGCSSFGKQKQVTEPLEVNPAIEKIIADKIEQDRKMSQYPRLADLPSERPTQMTPVKQRMVENSLTTERKALEQEIATDITFANAERMTNLSALAAAIRSAVNKDEQSAAKTAGQPMPVLGGKPPDPKTLEPEGSP
jgi:hypothetical protein